MYEIETKHEDGESTYFFDSWYDVLWGGLGQGIWCLGMGIVLVIVGVLSPIWTPWLAIQAALQERRLKRATYKEVEHEYRNHRFCAGRATSRVVGASRHRPLSEDQGRTWYTERSVDGGRNPALGTLPGGDAGPEQTA